MRGKTHRPKRRAATVVECAIVLPAAFFLMLALYVGALGVLRYQEVATLAREGARYASTHGYQYRKDNGQANGTATDWEQDIRDNAVLPHVVAVDPLKVNVSAQWPDVINQPGKPDNWPGSKVEVTVSYQWLPELYLVGPITLTSTSSMPITN
jgi:Flp pilus assembly protein TadG